MSANECAWTLAARAGLPWLFRRRNRRKILILMYHAIVEGERPYTLSTHLRRESFVRQIRCLKEHFHLMSLSEVLARMRSREPLPPNAAVVTFDDGFANNYTTAYPVLKEAGVPATIFLVTGFLDTGRPNWPDRLFLALRGTQENELDLESDCLGHHRFASPEERDAVTHHIKARLKKMPAAEKNRILDKIEAALGTSNRVPPEFAHDFAPLTWGQVQEMASSGLVEFGAHTIHHEILSRLPSEEMKREILGSCDTVRERLGLSEVTFAYPNGLQDDFTEEAKVVLRETGALCGLSTIEGLCDPVDDPFELKRIGVVRDMTLGHFAASSSGLKESLKSALGKT